MGCVAQPPPRPRIDLIAARTVQPSLHDAATRCSSVTGIGHGVGVSATPPKARPARIVIHDLQPRVDEGTHPPKLPLGDTLTVSATILRDGHETVRAVLRHRRSGADWTEHEMVGTEGTDRWSAAITPDGLGISEFQVEAWLDRFGSWHHEMERRIAGGQEDLGSELLEGAAIVAAAKLAGDDRARAKQAVATMRGSAQQADRLAAAFDADLAAAMRRSSARPERSRSAIGRVEVDPVRATFGTWYELFPRSWGGFDGIARQLPAFADLGVDVLYLPPIHPIGVRHRKGPNNTLSAGPGDPGSPWAIGGAAGGHDAIHPDLGSPAQFARLVGEARKVGIDIALDLALQCSPDHPWLTEHPEWFSHRPDGTLKYAENPPKKYQDIYNLDFDSPDWRGLWQALLDVVMHWVRQGVRIFRVDNPHTKPFGFWEWLIGAVRSTHPDVIFLAEAFTRPAVMFELAKVGFNQSYTYFTWRTSRQELTDYVTELASPAMAGVFRPNFFTNTPDILHAYLQHGGPPAFHARLVLAATLSPSYGIYSGFEHFENVPVHEGSEEYVDSEKYQPKQRRLDGPLLGVYRRLNIARRMHRALQRIAPVRFLGTANDQLIAYARGTGHDAVICVVNLDPHLDQIGLVDVHGDLDLPGSFAVSDVLSDQVFQWQVGGNYVALGPGDAHVLAILR